MVVLGIDAHLFKPRENVDIHDDDDASFLELENNDDDDDDTTW
jgi:hypothetical protein